MNQYDAIYVRQSVDRVDSISTESQAEFCKREVIGGDFKLYSDKGFSGKNTDRPAFQEMIRDITAGVIRRVIVYRLDRISRSVLDFANLNSIFEKYNVAFVSTMEKFDTSTPVGKAMLMIVMIFAQLERETIQQRVIDAYSSRSKHGFYMGGRVPYGFNLKETMIDGKRTKMYEPIESEMEIVKLIFSLYAEPQTSIGDVMRYLAAQGFRRRDGRPFSRNTIRDIIINPAYVRSDYQLYDFFKAQGTNIINPPEHFDGFGAYLYSGDTPKRKTISLANHILVLAPHLGCVDAKTWIKCRSKCLNNQSVAKPVKAKATWLAGKIKCAYCGYALISKISRRKTKPDERYFVCNNKLNAGECEFGSIHADIVHQIVFAEMQNKLQEYHTLSSRNQECCNLQVIKLKSEIEAIDKEISALLDKIAQANETVMQYINKRVAELDTQKKELYVQITQLNRSDERCIDEIRDYMHHWDELTISDKITVVDALIERINVSNDQIEIRWKI